jgi:hypothetical protein
MNEAIDSLVKEGKKSPEQAKSEVESKQGELIAQIINEELLLQKGKEMGVEADVEAQINRRFLDIMKQQNIKTLDALYKTMGESGVDPQSIREMGATLPTGILREPLNNLKRADAIVITRANLIEDVSNLKSQITKYNSICPIFVSENRISKLIGLKDFLAKPSGSSRAADNRRPAGNYLAFCALGNPNNFFEQLRRENFNLVAARKFPDHHLYAPKDIEKLVAKAKQTNAETLLTTAKDAVKLKDLNVDLPCFVAESEMIFRRKDDFRRWLLNAGN